MLITVAGQSTRFCRSSGQDLPKCLYHENDIEESLLWRLLHQDVAFDRYIIVGGFRYEILKETLTRDFRDMEDRIVLLNNSEYAKYGSGYSLYRGLAEALNTPCDEIVFAEGDLFFDKESFAFVHACSGNVITYINRPILASESVAFYFGRDERIHYIYDTDHAALSIEGSFTSIYNSGQVWKFSDRQWLESIFTTLPAEAWEGTNLAFIEAYFNSLKPADYKLVELKKWVNCNTVDDFHKIREGVTEYENNNRKACRSARQISGSQD